MPKPELEDLAEKIRSMSWGEQLQIAGLLLEAKKSKLAHAIAERVVIELGAALALEETRRG